MSDVTVGSSGSGHTLEAVAASQPPRRWTSVLLALAVVLAAYIAIGFIGVREEAREERVLGSLSPIFLGLRDAGGAAQSWMQTNRVLVGEIGSALLLAMTICAVIARGRRAVPVALLAAALGLAGWGQVAVQSNDPMTGVWLYLAGVACAVILGIWCPTRRLATFPPFPPQEGAGFETVSAASKPPQPAPLRKPAALSFGWECALVSGLTLVALLSRAWALTELYDFFDLETIEWIVEGRTWNGFLSYLNFGFVQNNGGAVQLLPTQLVFRLFGTSIFTLRMASVLWAIAAIPLMYALGRRLGGVICGVLASFLLITAPEQLFWARNENLHFAPMAVCALVTAHLALWMVERLSARALLFNALWMPWCRWFYSACMVAFLIPIATGLHALVFGRGLWRKLWYVLPLLGLGLAGWIFSLSVMRASIHGWQWQFVDPSAVYGASAWRKQGEFRDVSVTDLVRLQAVSMSTNFAAVVREMTNQSDNLSHWCQRAQPGEHRTILNVGLTIVVFIGLGYLLGQFHDRRAFVLLAWWGIAVLPAILSQDPADRRMAMVFPASHAVAAMFLAAALRMVAERGGQLADAVGRMTAAGGLALIGLTNLASHLQLPINPVLYSDYPRLTQPMFEHGDAIFTNIPSPFRTLAVFGNLDHFLEEPTCMQFVDPHLWLESALNPRCLFDDPVYHISIGDAATEQLRRTYVPKRISYWLVEEPASAPQIALLTALHPDAPLLRHAVPRGERTLVTMSVDADSVEKLRTPSLIAGAETPPLLAGVPTQRVPGENGADPPGGPTVAGGILIDTDGWYRWRLDPACPAATLMLDDTPADATAAQPMLAGVHPFRLAVPRDSGCALPLHIVMDRTVPAQLETLGANRFASEKVAELPNVRAPRVEVFDGYDPPASALRFKGRPVDFGVDAQGNVSVLLHEGEGYRIRRYDSSGKELAAWDVPTPLTINVATIAVSPRGEHRRARPAYGPYL